MKCHNEDPSDKKGEKGSDEIASGLFVYVPKVEVEINHGGLTSIAHNFGDDKQHQSLATERELAPRTKE
jgi:hypothetical protein